MPTVLSSLIPLVLGALAGAALGVAFFHGLALATRLTLAGDLRRALPLHALRLGGVAAVFTLTAIHAGAASLLGLLAGFQLAKEVMVRRAEKTP